MLSLTPRIAVFLKNIPMVKSKLFFLQGSPLRRPLAHSTGARSDGQRQCHSRAQAGMQAMGTKQGRREGPDSLGSQTCFSCFLRSAGMLCVAPSHLLAETSKHFTPASPFSDFSGGLGWQFKPCKAEKEPDHSPPQEMLTTSPADTTTIA